MVFWGTDTATQLAVEGLMPDYMTYPFVVLVTTVSWLAVTFFGKPEDDAVLYRFYERIRPGGPGWKRVLNSAKAEDITLEGRRARWYVPAGIAATLVGLVVIYGALFSTGYWIYGGTTQAATMTGVALVVALVLVKLWSKIKEVFFKGCP